MNCDAVFFTLTKGPFPTGHPSDSEVDAHLEECVDCWRFAQALRPSGEIFQEALTSRDFLTLPGYWGDSRPPEALAEVSGLVTRTLVLPRRRTPRTQFATLPAAQECIGWREIVQVGFFVFTLVAVVSSLTLYLAS